MKDLFSGAKKRKREKKIIAWPQFCICLVQIVRVVNLCIYPDLNRISGFRTDVATCLFPPGQMPDKIGIRNPENSRWPWSIAKEDTGFTRFKSFNKTIDLDITHYYQCINFFIYYFLIDLRVIALNACRCIYGLDSNLFEQDFTSGLSNMYVKH